jgi:hypothetical protein
MSATVDGGEWHDDVPAVARRFDFRVAMALEGMPLWIGLSYLLITLLLFYIGPYDWPVTNGAELILVVLLSFVMLLAGYATGLRTVSRPVKFAHPQAIFIIGTVAAVALITPSCWIYTGHWPWELGAALADQNKTYMGMQQQLQDLTGQRGPISAARAVAAPFIFAVLPLGIIHWQRLPWKYRLMMLATVSCSAIFSILRGTNRELADLIIVGLSAAMVVLARHCRRHNLNFGTVMARAGRFALILLVALGLLFSVFSSRISGRLADTENICLGESQVCADFNRGVYAYLPEGATLGAAALTGYLSQGYFGVSLALEEPFRSGYGVAHSPALSSLFVLLGGDPAIVQRTYIYRIGDRLWDSSSQWSTLLVWLANDVGFTGALAILFLIGLLWCRAWRDAVEQESDKAAVAFCVFMMMIFYFPANNQMTSTFDAYATLIGWVGGWLVTRRTA